jgi:hypothetical protein
VELRVYEGADVPEQLLAAQILKPQFLDYSNQSGTFGLKDKNMDFVATENFVRFDPPVPISKKFFIAYRIDNAPDSKFTVYNTEFTSEKANRAWMNIGGTWMPANSLTPQPVTTSLAIQALLSYTDDAVVDREKGSKIIYVRKANRLMLPGNPPEAGQIFIYSISGQLLQRTPVAKEQDMVMIRPYTAGTVAIARLIRGNQIYTEKFIY